MLRLKVTGEKFDFKNPEFDFLNLAITTLNAKVFKTSVH